MPKDKERHARVLVVDDEESIRHFLTLSLQREGFEVKVAALCRDLQGDESAEVSGGADEVLLGSHHRR